MSRKHLFYNFFFPRDKKLPFPKLRWTIMIHIQELSMCKYRAVFKYWIKKSYRKDINVLRDILSYKRLTGTKGELWLDSINFSHEINYPKWVDKLIRDLEANPKNYQRIKVFFHNDKYIVIDGNHRLKALKTFFDEENTKVDVLILKYVD